MISFDFQINIKMRITTRLVILSGLLIASGLSSCKKFLDKKPLQEQLIPENLDDLQAFLDHPDVAYSDPGLLQILSDEYYISSDFYNQLTPDLAQNYIWGYNAIPYDASWNSPYTKQIYFANIVLDQLADLNFPSDNYSNRVKGSALFYRGNAFFNVAQVYANSYSESDLEKPGIVLRLTSDINVKSERSSIKNSYNQIISDVTEATRLLPNQSTIQSRPTKYSAYGLLARIFLSMGKYDSAYKYSEACLAGDKILLDFNELTPGVPINSFNREVVFHSVAPSGIILIPVFAKIDSLLISSYKVGDLRKDIFFVANPSPNNKTYAFRGSYDGTNSLSAVFTGITVAEMLLIKAECLTRKGQINESINTLNKLLKKRWKSDSWIPTDPTTVSDPLELILEERRKELVYRGIRWMDIKRLNRDGANIKLRRMINGVEYNLNPTERKWLPLIPLDVINRSGIEQNINTP